MALVIRHPWRWAGGAALAAAALIAVAGWLVYPYAAWFYRTVPMWEFVPACIHPEKQGGFWELNDLDYVEGEPTAEFWSALRAYLLDVPNRPIWPKKYFADGRVYVTLAFHFAPPAEGYAKYGGEPEEHSFHITREVAYRMHRRRVKAGFYDGRDLSGYRVPVRRHDGDGKATRLLDAEACGFLQELILKGGAFAGPVAAR